MHIYRQAMEKTQLSPATKEEKISIVTCLIHVRKVLKDTGILLNGKKTAKSIAISGNDQLPILDEGQTNQKG